MKSLPGLSNRWSIVLIATLFNLLFEYAGRGVNNLRAIPLLPVVLFIAYFTYFALLEDLVVRFRLKDYHLIFPAFLIGTIYEFYVSGAAIFGPQLLGVNWPVFLFIALVAWWALQGVITLYLANRIVPRDWGHPRLSATGWAAALGLNLSAATLIHLGGKIPLLRPVQLLIATGILIVALGAFCWSLPRRAERAKVPVPEGSLFLDALCGLTVALFVLCAVILTGDPTRLGASAVNLTAVRIAFGWSTVVAIVALLYRLYSRRPIPV